MKNHRAFYLPTSIIQIIINVIICIKLIINNTFNEELPVAVVTGNEMSYANLI